MKDGGIVTEISLEAIFDAKNLQRAFESFEGKRVENLFIKKRLIPKTDI